MEASCDSFLEELSWKSTKEMPRLLEPIHSLMGCHQLLSCKSAAGGAASDSDGVAGAVDGVLDGVIDGDFAVGARALRPVQGRLGDEELLDELELAGEHEHIVPPLLGQAREAELHDALALVPGLANVGAAASEKRNWLSRMLRVHGESFVTSAQVESCTTSNHTLSVELSCNASWRHPIPAVESFSKVLPRDAPVADRQHVVRARRLEGLGGAGDVLGTKRRGGAHHALLEDQR